MSNDIRDQPRPNPAGRELHAFRFGSYEVDPVPAGSFFVAVEPEPELDDSPIIEGEID
jgi:hypothetical protein